MSAEDGPSKQPPTSQQQQKDGTTTTTKQSKLSPLIDSQWDEYFKALNSDYIKKVTMQAPKDEYTVIFPDGSSKIYKRHKPSVKQFKELEISRAMFEEMTKRQDIVEHAAKNYFKCAQVYLDMTQDDFESASWEDLKLILDACNFRTLYGLPLSPKT